MWRRERHLLDIHVPIAPGEYGLKKQRFGPAGPSLPVEDMAETIHRDHTNGANPRDEGTLYTINLSSSGPREGYVSMPKMGGCVQTNRGGHYRSVSHHPWMLPSTSTDHLMLKFDYVDSLIILSTIEWVTLIIVESHILFHFSLCQQHYVWLILLMIPWLFIFIWYHLTPLLHLIAS